MKDATDFERPIDWLAARGITSSLTPDPDCYVELPSWKMIQLANRYHKDTGKPKHACLKELAEALGFKNYDHYVDHMKRKGQYKNRADRLARKRAKASARKQAKEYCQEGI